MNANPGKLQPLQFAAALSVIIFSLVGVAAFTGHLPGASSTPGIPSTPVPAPVPAASSTAATAPKSAPVRCAECGIIEQIRAVQVTDSTSGLGAAAGGVTGALIGRQFGHGDGRTIAALAGAAGGAYAGNSIEKNLNERVVYRIVLRMDDGSGRALTQSAAPPYAVGDRVRVVNQQIVERV